MIKTINNNYKKNNLILWLVLTLLLVPTKIVLATTNNKLVDINISTEVGSKAKIELIFALPPTMPESFSLEEPTKMVFDFIGVKNKLPANKLSQRLDLELIKEVNIVATDEQTRLVVDLDHIVPQHTEIFGNTVIIMLNVVVKDNKSNNLKKTTKKTSEKTQEKIKPKDLNAEISNYIAELVTAKKEVVENNKELNFQQTAEKSGKEKNKFNIKAVDFRRADDGAGRVEVELATLDLPIDFKEDKDYLVVEFKQATVAAELQRRFDVKDFGTPVQLFAVIQDKDKVLIKIKATGEIDKIAYQVDDKYVVEVRHIGQAEKELNKSRVLKFTGERISLNFQDIEIRAVLQLMADFTGLNIVASDSVAGHVTLRLENVPWDQALDFILKSKGLGKRESGNVILIAPNEEIASREQLEIESRMHSESLAPLRSEFIQINYAKAADIMKMLKEDKNSMISTRGTITIDDRTNTLIVKDTEDKLAEIKNLLEKLDIPVRQVLIESQIVETSNQFEEALGIRVGGALQKTLGKYQSWVTSSITNSRTNANAGNNAASATGLANETNTSSMFFDGGDRQTNGNTGSVGISLARLPGGTLLDLELRASEYEQTSKILSKPKLLTLDQQTASIESGNEIPYTVTAQNGATPTTSFKKAVLRLEVKPQITPNDKILMDLTVNQDRPGAVVNGQTGINTTSLITHILVDNGETIVLGGIYTITQDLTRDKIPLFGDIPIVGKLFKSRAETSNKREVLIFVTPKIVRTNLES